MKKYPRVGRYVIQNKEKYVANLQECEYRSSWELKYMKYLDRHPNVVEWGSENVILPYYNPIEKKYRRYFVDFYVKVKTTTGEYKKYIVEVKPAIQCKPPVKPKKQTQAYIKKLKVYIMNQAKFKAARKWADKRGWEFIILTEKDLGIKTKKLRKTL
ncbi:uncharacterized protein METZ01_LOCUS66605 [marine metagenome]|uniref:TnsA endonuclease N-terminal domain-containing protein n=1 Tax=marine metagenome TaxID=408172 RepID=A0A381TE18_9ZZZZ